LAAYKTKKKKTNSLALTCRLSVEKFCGLENEKKIL